ncbi:MAG TPA: hypothetical protein VF889_05735 [Bacteroidota bacterium]
MLSALLNACGGGGSGGPATTPIAVTSSPDPVLKGKTAVITANFANYTSTIKLGSRVNFSVTSPATFVPANIATAQTQAGGIATIVVTSATPGTITVTASSGSFAGSTKVSFIDLPAAATVVVTPQQAINSLGALSFNITNDIPVTFTGFSSVNGSSTLAVTNPAPLPPNNTSITQITAAILSAGLDVTPSTVLFRFLYAVPPTATDIPRFTISSSTISAAFFNTSTVRPRSKLIVTPAYFDVSGRQLYP